MEILFCIPGGGTSSLMYMGWQKLLKDEFTIIPLEIPGRDGSGRWSGHLLWRKSQREWQGRSVSRQMADRMAFSDIAMAGSWHTRSAGFWRRKENVCRRIFIFVEHQLLLRRFLSHRC